MVRKTVLSAVLDDERKGNLGEFADEVQGSVGLDESGSTRVGRVQWFTMVLRTKKGCGRLERSRMQYQIRMFHDTWNTFR